MSSSRAHGSSSTREKPVAGRGIVLGSSVTRVLWEMQDAQFEQMRQNRKEGLARQQKDEMGGEVRKRGIYEGKLTIVVGANMKTTTSNGRFFSEAICMAAEFRPFTEDIVIA